MKLIEVSRGLFAKVDNEDFADLAQFNWTIKTSSKENVFYAKRFTMKDGKQTTELMHRRIMKAGKGIEVDHIDHDGLNNQKSNLRVCNRAENSRNRRDKVKPGGFIGVTEYKGKFNARIWSNYKSVNLGTFDTAEEAAKIRDYAAKQLRGDFAKLNFHTAPEPVEKDEK